MNTEKRPELEKSEVIESLPKACCDETAAVEFFEQQRWGNTPTCPHCKSADVYKMTDRGGTRNKRYLWRCRGCAEQYTVRIGTVYEESRLPLRHWAFAFWRACTSKKGVSALEIQRQCQISYKSALFLMHRIRFAVTETEEQSQYKLGGEGQTVEIDETYCGGIPRPQAFGAPKQKRHGKGYRSDSNKVPVIAMLQRGGGIRTKVVANVTQRNVQQFIRDNVATRSIVNTDQSVMYPSVLWPIIKHEGGRHDVVNHAKKEYARHNVDGTISHINCCESFFSLLKRGLMGTFHAVSKEHLHRYANEFAFRWDTRKLNDGQRVVAAIQRGESKRLTYENYVAR